MTGSRFAHLARRIRRRWIFARACRDLSRLSPQQGLPTELAERLARGWGNPGWEASTSLLQVVWAQVHGTRGAILECGSGLTTIVLGVATRGSGRFVRSLEHDPAWARRVTSALRRFRCHHAQVFRVPLKSFDTFDWYAIEPAGVGGPFVLVVCDGPPGATRGGRVGLLPCLGDQLAPGARIILDDAARPGEQAVVATWERNYGLVRSELTPDVALLTMP
jgi:hypothetical protein